MLEPSTLAVQRDLDGGVLLLEQALPGRDRRQVLLGRDPLLGLAEEVGPAEAGDPEVVADGVEPGVGQQRLRPLVVERGPLELEEQQLGADRGGPLLDLGDERAAGLVAGVGGEAQAGVAVGPRQVLLEAGQAVHEGSQPGGVQLGHVASRLGQRGRPGVGLVEEPLDARHAVAADQRLQIPVDVIRRVEVGAERVGHAGQATHAAPSRGSGAGSSHGRRRQKPRPTLGSARRVCCVGSSHGRRRRARSPRPTAGSARRDLARDRRTGATAPRQNPPGAGSAWPGPSPVRCRR